MSDELVRLLNLAAQLIAQGEGRTDARLVLVVGTLRVPLRVVGFDDIRNQLALEMVGAQMETRR